MYLKLLEIQKAKAIEAYIKVTGEYTKTTVKTC